MSSGRIAGGKARQRGPRRLLTAPWLVPITSPAVADGALLLDADDTILAVGRRADLLDAGVTEERAEGALLPGLVNAHVHLELSALAGRVAGGTGLVDWAFSVMRTRTDIDDAKVRAGASQAARAAVQAGTAAVGEVANSLDHMLALSEAGLRGVVFHELLGSRDARTGDALADAEDERQEFLARHRWPAGVGYVPAPHAPYSADPDFLRRLFEAAAASKHPTSLHVAEDPDELALLHDGSGKWAPILASMGVAPGSRTPKLRPVAYLESLGAFAGPRPPLLVHMVHADEDDRSRAARHGATAVLCPRSNLHIGGKLPDVPLLIAAGVPLALGTDSLASTPSLSLWGEVATLAKAFPAVPPTVWLHAATRGGAVALGLEALGALAVGARPGVLEVPLPETGGADDLLATLVLTPDPAVRWRAHP